MRKLALFSVVLAMLGMAGTASAQTATGQITGTVKDATGAVVPGATITVISELTGSKRETISGKDGNDAIPLLSVSTYSVTASPSRRPVQPQGFQRSLFQTLQRCEGRSPALSCRRSVPVRAEAGGLPWRLRTS